MEPNQNQQPVENQQIAGEKRSLGPVIGIIVVVILLVLGALYVWGGKLSDETSIANDEAAAIAPSDEVSAIESELGTDGELEIDLSELDSIE